MYSCCLWLLLGSYHWAPPSECGFCVRHKKHGPLLCLTLELQDAPGSGFHSYIGLVWLFCPKKTDLSQPTTILLNLHLCHSFGGCYISTATHISPSFKPILFASLISLCWFQYVLRLVLSKLHPTSICSTPVSYQAYFWWRQQWPFSLSF